MTALRSTDAGPGVAALDAGQHALLAAVQAVNERHRETEIRRLAQQPQTGRDTATALPLRTVVVPRASFDAMLAERRAADALRRLFDDGPAMPIAFEALPPYRLREAPRSLSRATGRCVEPGLVGRALETLFDAADAQRIAKVLHAPMDGHSAEFDVQLKRTDGSSLPCRIHVAAPDPQDGGVRRACLIRLQSGDPC
jgi:hypothetical protein